MRKNSGNAIGTYEVANNTVNLVKSVVITDPMGGNQPVTGATLTYSITVTVTGPGTATSVVITDPLPAGFEIDNPNLLKSGSTGSLTPLM